MLPYYSWDNFAFLKAKFLECETTKRRNNYNYLMQEDLIDFEQIRSAGIDAIYLTKSGVNNTMYSFPKNLYGWDCESVLVINKKSIIDFL